MPLDAPLEPAFFVAEGDAFRATVYTRGPWSPDLEHGGPPAALLARAAHRRAAQAGMQVVRLTVEFLRPIPIDRFTVREQPLRPGKKVMITGASLYQGDAELVRATALCIRTAAFDLPAVEAPPSPPPEACPPLVFPFVLQEVGYHRGMELRLARGTLGSGALTVWMRQAVPLVLGEEPSPLERVVIAADSGNGVSVALDTRHWTFVNPDLTVYLHRLPRGEWVQLDAVTTPQPHGIALADTALFDAVGPIGRSVQSLIVQRR